MAFSSSNDLHQQVLLVDPGDRVRRLLESAAMRPAWSVNLSHDSGAAGEAIACGLCPAVLLLTVDPAGEREALAAVKALRCGPHPYDTRVVALLDEGLLLDEERLLKEHQVDVCWRLNALTPALLDGIVTSELRTCSRVRSRSNSPTSDDYLRSMTELIGLHREFMCSIEGSQAGEWLSSPEAPAPRVQVRLPRLLEEVRGLVDENREGLVRLRELVALWRDEACAVDIELQPTDLHAGIDRALHLLRPEIDQGIEIIREYTDIPKVQCDPALLEQVFLHLIRNAIDALDGADGQIRIATVECNAHAVIAIRDSGPTMPFEVIPEKPGLFVGCWDPGSGAALALSSGIVERHGGHVEVDRRAGAYTEIRLHLPINGALDGSRVTH